MYAVYFGIRKNYTQAHKTARMTREYWVWQEREFEEDWKRVKEEPTALLWEINLMKLPALMDEPNFCLS